MKLFPIFLVISVTILVISCGKSDKELAAEKIQLAQLVYQAGDTTQALLHVDSIRSLYPTAIQEITAANQLRNTIYSELLYRKQDELDTLLNKIEALEKNFITEKTEFDRYTQYIHKRQEPVRRWNKSYIQVHLDERGELYISSNYYGETQLNHTGLRVYDNDIQAKTEKVELGNALNHQSDFWETKWEKVSYTNGADNGAIEFIAENADRNLKAVFLGDEYYYIILEDYDKQAIKDALALSKLLKQKISLEAEVKSIQSKVG